jgi:hypothetical protein
MQQRYCECQGSAAAMSRLVAPALHSELLLHHLPSLSRPTGTTGGSFATGILHRGACRITDTLTLPEGFVPNDLPITTRLRVRRQGLVRCLHKVWGSTRAVKQKLTRGSGLFQDLFSETNSRNIAVIREAVLKHFGFGLASSTVPF